MEIKVENIKCHGCANSIKNGLLKVKGVEDVDVRIDQGIIDVKGKDIDRNEIVSRLHSMGYPEPGQGSGITTATSFVSCMIGRVTS